MHEDKKPLCTATNITGCCDPYIFNVAIVHYADATRRSSAHSASLATGHICCRVSLGEKRSNTVKF